MAVEKWNFLVALTAAIFAMAAFLIAWRDSQRNNRVLLKLKDLTATYHGTEHGETLELRFRLENHGIQMQDISVALGFFDAKAGGYLTQSIPVSDKTGKVVGSFLRGSTVEFVLSLTSRRGHERHGSKPSFEDRQLQSHLSYIEDFKTQRPEILVYNGAFLSVRFPIWSRWDRVKWAWNWVTWKLALKRRVGPGPEGKGVYRYYQLPGFHVRSNQLRVFLDGVREIEGDEPRSNSKASKQ